MIPSILDIVGTAHREFAQLDPDRWKKSCGYQRILDGKYGVKMHDRGKPDL